MGKRIIRVVLIAFGILLAVLLIGPFLIPVPPLEGTLPPEQLADPNSKFIDIHNVNLHYKEHGEGDPVFVLLHGFGASEFSWREVVAPLSKLGDAIMQVRFARRCRCAGRSAPVESLLECSSRTGRRGRSAP